MREDFKIGSRVRLIPELCRQIELRKLHGTVLGTHDSDPPIEVEWDNKDIRHLDFVYPSEIKDLK